MRWRIWLFLVSKNEAKSEPPVIPLSVRPWHAAKVAVLIGKILIGLGVSMNGGTPTGIVMEKPIEIGCCSFQLPKTHWLFAELNYLVLQ